MNYRNLIWTGMLAITSLTATSCKCFKKNNTMENEKNTTEMTTGRKPAPFMLDNTEWRLVRIDAQDKPFVPTEDQKQIVLTFSEGNMGTSDGCNSIGASYKQDKYLIFFDMFRSTKMYCDQEYMKKNGYMVPFNQAKEFFVENDTLFFLDNKGKRIATYERIRD